MIIRRGQRRPDYVLNSNGHDPLIKKFKLKDDRLIDRKFVRIECLPLGSLTSVDPSDWEVNVDEHGTLPGWFEEKQHDWSYKCLKLLTRIIIPKWITDGVGGSLYLRGTKVTSLGTLTSVGGSLYLEDTKVTSLGKLTSVGRFLDLRDTKVTSLGKLTSVGRSLDLRDTKVTSVPESLKEKVIK
jgi:hypothetical protein